jgi:hypothetical protein
MNRISDLAVVPYPPDQSSRPDFRGFRGEETEMITKVAFSAATHSDTEIPTVVR